MKIKPKAKTEEEAKREAEVIKTRQDCYEEQLRMTMDAITNPPPDELEEGTIVEVLSEDFKGVCFSPQSVSALLDSAAKL